MKEIPISYVRSNQAAMVLLIALSALFQQPWIILVVFAVEAAGLIFGVRGNLFVTLARPFLRNRISNSQTESAELQRFNNSIAVTLLTLSVVSFAIGSSLAGYIFAGMVALAAFGAICGYCLGCTLYYQFKRLRARRH
jgi:predicted membrane channel-forming protein YqfA (hemolysin III family)